MRTIEPKQIQLLHIQKGQLSLTEDEYRDAIAAHSKRGVRSSKGLTFFEADALITYFAKQGAKIQSNYIRTSGEARRARWGYANAARSVRKNAGNVVAMCSPDQLAMIETLAGKIAWKYEDGYQRWLRKYHKVDHVRTAAKAEMVIESLKKMLSNQPGNDGCRTTG